MAGNIAGNLVAPLINKKAIQADYLTANAKQLQAVYNYQRVVLNAFTEVVNRISMVANYGTSVEIKKQQVKSLEESVDSATKLLAAAQPGVDYLDVLFAQRDLMDARMVLIETKMQQLSAIVNAYQALGGGNLPIPTDGSGHQMRPHSRGPQFFPRSARSSYCTHRYWHNIESDCCGIIHYTSIITATRRA